MTVLHACGYGPPNLLKHSLIMASIVSALVLVILLWVNPAIALERTKLLRSSGVQMLIKTLEPGRFGSLPGGGTVFYVEKMDGEHAKAEGIFLAHLSKHQEKSRWDVVFADGARVTRNKTTDTNDLLLTDGRAYQGKPGDADFRVVNFKRFETPLPEPVITPKAGDMRAVQTKDLWAVKDNAKAAELVWRFSIPFMVLVLTLVGVPLSRVNPRSGKYAKLLPAILIFIVYADLMFVARDAISSGKLPWWLVLIGLHGSVASIGVGLMWRNRVRPA